MTDTDSCGHTFILVHKPKNCDTQYCKGKDWFPGQTTTITDDGLHGRIDLILLGSHTGPEAAKSWASTGRVGQQEVWAQCLPGFPGHRDKLQKGGRKVRFTGGNTATACAHAFALTNVFSPAQRFPDPLTHSFLLANFTLPLVHFHSFQPRSWFLPRSPHPLWLYSPSFLSYTH